MERAIREVYVDPKHGRWRVSGENQGTSFSLFADKETAVSEGRRLAKSEHGQLIVRHANGTLEFAEDFASVER
jgi:hypothetical protein